jgi:serine/threonine-protein kinase
MPTIAGDSGQPARAAEERPLPKIDGYEILGELGRGGMGVVYRAREVLLNRPCALKMILAGAHADEEATLRFMGEAEAVARLQHPNVVQIYHIGQSGGLPFFELEYLDGGSLEKRLDGTPWAPRTAAALVESLTRGVAEAHRLGIVHRDLKPGNVLLAADGTPKITDFGLAKSLTNESGLTRTDSILGSPEYMAPEQAEGKAKEVRAAADIYALGAMFYELLTGRPPFRGVSILQTLEQAKTTEPVPPSRLVPGLPSDVETIALKCLQKDAGKRYESATGLADDLARFLNGEPIVARPVGAIERGWRWCRRNPVVASLAGALTAILLLATAASLVAYGRMRHLASREHSARLTAVQEMQAAQQARVQEAVERRRAEMNFQKAREAVDGYLTAVSESQLLNVPGLQPLRGQLLDSALRFYQDFLKARRDDPTLRAELAATHARVGRIQAELGATEEARRALKAAVAAYEAAIANDPQDMSLRAALADTWQSLSEFAYNFGGPDQRAVMIDACQHMVELREVVARSRPNDLDCQRELAVAYVREGGAEDWAGRDGFPALFRGAEMHQALLLESPDDPKVNHGLGEALNNIGVCLANMGRHADSLDMYLRSAVHHEIAYDKLPHMIDYACDVATSHMNAVRANRHLGRSEAAVAEAQKAVAHSRRLVRAHPAVPIVKRHFIWSLESLVDSQRDAGLAAEAARTGRELGQWLDIVVDEPHVMFDGAIWHARLSAWANERRGVLANQEQNEAHREADRAVEQLQRAIEAGFTDLNAIRSDATLDPLRARSDFQKLVARLEARLKARRKDDLTAGPEPAPAADPLPRAERVFRARALRAAILHAAGVIQRGRNHRREARTALDEARALCEGLLRERPSDITLPSILADTQGELDSLNRDEGTLNFDAAFPPDAFAR